MARPDPDDVRHLQGQSLARCLRLRQPADRARMATGQRLLALVARAVSGDPSARVVRRCSTCGSTQHGAPRIAAPHDRFGISLSHSHELVVVAASDQARVGVDVERVRHHEPRAAALFCAPGELAADLRSARPDLALTTRWVRKEAVLKAAGWGLASPPVDVRISDVGDRPGVRSWSCAAPAGIRPEQVGCADLPSAFVGEDYVGAVAVIGAQRVVVEVILQPDPWESRLGAGPRLRSAGS
ncbi:MAG: 4'-phosphopantetheinyl transferase superfamily protein [Intrasporangium sp.]|uniref:4'-phosphopantetheinyl transferase family protein n=1 Tax=Intrasporangium sp. TaxID=1925024 RepID=UPI002647C387|nr:4'-phosphopantetheinyl transferase superfamily protein [Intrasporangium sp.]MDN5794434.1 4'-phosphopantetheinyl transferase superfamily protein [Intrasporangium sp.]